MEYMSEQSSINSPKVIVTWCGRDIEELSKEELIEVVKCLGREIERARDAHRCTLEMWEVCRNARS